MIKNFKGELGVAIGLLVLLFVVFNPWNVLMPGYIVMALLIGLVVLFVAFAAFVWEEGRGDERESFHHLFADRVAYLAGSAFLLTGVIIEELGHALDPWLILVLAVVVIAKAIGLVYSKIKL